VTWVGWRLQRTETLVAAAVLAALALLLVPEGLHMASAFRSGDVVACVPARTPACGAAVSGFLDRFTFVRGVLDWLRLVPGLIGVLLAAPLVLELESGTHRLAWTQGVTRRRLLTTKLGVAVVTCLLAAGAFSLLLTWCRAPLDRVIGRMVAGYFDVEWIVPLGWVIGQFAAAGYRRFFDVELLGPRIAAEGARQAMTRGVRHVSALLRAAYPNAPASGTGNGGTGSRGEPR